MKKIWMISDTHGCHEQLPKAIADIVIHSGDCSNRREPVFNQFEVKSFIDWYASLDIQYKVFVAGNHDTSIWKGLISPSYIKDKGIIYLEHSGVEIEGINIWGSPYTPTFGEGWAWNVRRDRLTQTWLSIPVELDILVTHGPPKGILDISVDREDNIEFCGDLALYKAVINREIKYHQFGHIHNNGDIQNAGTKTLSNQITTFVNASCVTDRKMGELSSSGEIIEI